MKFGERCATDFWDQMCRDATLPYRIALSKVKQRHVTPEELLQALVSRLSPDGQTRSTVQQGFFGKKIVLGSYLLSRINAQSTWRRETGSHSPDTSVFYNYVDRQTGILVHENRDGRLKARFDGNTIASRFLIADEALIVISEFEKIYTRLRQMPSSDYLTQMCDRRLTLEQLAAIDDSQLNTDRVLQESLKLVDPQLWLEQEEYGTGEKDKFRRETWKGIESTIGSEFGPLIDSIVRERIHVEIDQVNSLELRCIDFDSQTRKLFLKDYFPTALVQEARSKGINSNRENELELFRIAIRSIGPEYGLEFRQSGELQKGMLDSDKDSMFLSLLNTWVRQERLAESNLLQHDLLHTLPQPMPSGNSRELGIQQQLRASVCGDLDKIRGGAVWQNSKSGDHANTNFQTNLLSYYRVYLSAVFQILNRAYFKTIKIDQTIIV